MPLRSAHPDGVLLEGHCPVVALLTKGVDARHRLFVEWLVVPDGRWKVHRPRGWIPSRSVRAARCSSTAACSLPVARWASARPMRACAASYGTPTSFQSRTASDRDRSAPAASPSASRTLPRARAALATSALLRIGRRRAPARRRPMEPDRHGRPRSRPRPAPRAAARAEGRCSVVAPLRASATGGRGQLGWRQPRWPRLRRPGLPTRDPAGDPTGHDAPRGKPPPRPRCSFVKSDQGELVQRPPELASQVGA